MKTVQALGVLGRIVPQGIHAAEIEDHGQQVPLRQSERGVVAGAGAKRIRDFTLGRDCAHRALAYMGTSADAIIRDDNGAPLWPSGVLGSITHTEGFAAAAVAPATLVSGIGIDAERVQDLAANVASRIFGPAEMARLADLTPDARMVAAAALFSAKEAYFKACAPPAGNFKFREVEVLLAGDTFRVSAASGSITGRWALSGNLVVTAIVVPAA